MSPKSFKGMTATERLAAYKVERNMLRNILLSAKDLGMEENTAKTALRRAKLAKYEVAIRNLDAELKQDAYEDAYEGEDDVDVCFRKPAKKAKVSRRRRV